MNPRPAWIQQADAGLRRAALRARELAERTNTRLMVMKDGKIVDLLAVESKQRVTMREKEGRR